jgi:shikimate kinase
MRSFSGSDAQPLQNVVLIGMPGVGKSTLGVLLAKALGFDFLDTDLSIQRRAGKTLSAYMDNKGYQALRDLEAQVIQEIDCQKTVIATGGSAVYSAEAMARLGSLGVIVYLRCSVETLVTRIPSMADRGIAAPPGQTLAAVAAERVPLYQRYADITVDIQDLDSHQALTAMQTALSCQA